MRIPTSIAHAMLWIRRQLTIEQLFMVGLTCRELILWRASRLNRQCLVLSHCQWLSVVGDGCFHGGDVGSRKNTRCRINHESLIGFASGVRNKPRSNFTNFCNTEVLDLDWIVQILTPFQ